MKRILAASLILLFVGGVYTVAKENDTPYVQASSTVTKEINPNFAEISIAVETKGKAAESVATENAQISSAVVASLKSLLDTKKGESIETVNYNVNPQYSHKDGKTTIVGYTVSNTVKVKTRDVKSVSALIDAAMASGANRVSGLNFGYEEESLICNELYAKATKNAYSQAQSVAKAIGSEVTGARNIDTNCYVEGQTRYARNYASGMADTMSMKTTESTPIEASTLKVRATINGTFNIK